MSTILSFDAAQWASMVELWERDHGKTPSVSIDSAVKIVRHWEAKNPNRRPSFNCDAWTAKRKEWFSELESYIQWMLSQSPASFIH